jgi:hypothetical protein
MANLRRFFTGIKAVEINSSSITGVNGWGTGVRRGIDRAGRWVVLASCSMTTAHGGQKPDQGRGG